MGGQERGCASLTPRDRKGESPRSTRCHPGAGVAARVSATTRMCHCPISPVRGSRQDPFYTAPSRHKIISAPAPKMVLLRLTVRISHLANPNAHGFSASLAFRRPANFEFCNFVLVGT